MPLRRWAVFGTLDRYVIRLFVAAYLVALMMIVGLYVVVDMAGHLDDYLKPNDLGISRGFGPVARFYCLHLPFQYLSVAPFVTLMAGLFTVVKLHRGREVIAGLSAGISTRRLLLPIFFCSACIAVFTAALREVATEMIGFERISLRYELDHHRSEMRLDTVRLKDKGGEMIQLGSFTPGIGIDRRAEQPSVFEDLDAIRLIDGAWFHFVAERGMWHGEADAGHWELEGGYQERVGSVDRSRQPLEFLGGQLEFTPRDVWSAWKGREDALELSLIEARRLAARDPDNVQYRTLMNYLVAFPLANLTLLLVGLPFLMQFERGRGSEGLVAGFLLCVVYFATDFVALNMGLQGQLDPILASALPPLFFGSLGLVLFGSMRT